jgi:hypothetical protein
MHIVKNRYLNALLLLMLFSAILHMTVLVIRFAGSGNWNLLNFFTIVGLQPFLPAFWSGNTVSVLAVLALYGIILKLNK